MHACGRAVIGHIAVITTVLQAPNRKEISNKHYALVTFPGSPGTVGSVLSWGMIQLAQHSTQRWDHTS